MSKEKRKVPKVSTSGLSHEESKKVTRFLAENPKPTQEFLDSTHENRGASMFLSNKKMVNWGDNVHIVGKEPSRKTGKAVPTEFEDKGSLNPKLSSVQFAQHFMRLKSHAKSDKALIGSWIDANNPKKGVQIDLSGGYKNKETAERKMISRNEDAIVSANEGFNETFHEDVRHKYTDTPRPPKEN